jgi:hydroxymethylpyrimidine/phosphomethylpyrimidine kinase
MLYAALVCIVGQCAIGADVYKTVDAQGHVVYSDHPISSASQLITVQVAAPNAQEAARLTKEQAMQSAQSSEDMKQMQQAAADQQKQAAQEALQKQRCDAARSRLATFTAGGRLFRTDEQGNRVYYSDDEIEAERVAAKSAMDSACPQ